MAKRITVISFCLLISAIGLTQQTHTVKKGDTLWRISATYLDEPFYWGLIYKTNMDQIEDPHWIFPGQRFIIPPILERVSAEMEISTTETTPVAKEMVAPPEEFAPPAERQEEQESRGLAIAQEEVVSWKREIPVVSPALVYRAGYITEELPQWGKIAVVEEPGPKTIVSHHQVVINKGAKDGVVEGDLFTVLRIGKGVKHPHTRRYLGKIIHILGTLRAISIEEGSFRALVEACYEPIRLGDIVIPFDKIDIPVGKEIAQTGRRLQGVVVGKLTSERKLLPSDIVYIDKGKVDGIHSGDIFEIYREGKKIRGVVKPMKVVGELQILGVREETSSAVINSIDNKLDLKVGELIKLIKEAI